ncbi:MAG: hypothetical protein COA78_28225 [Blastopirellula sp.]|nr:MAG: hypothetical protein COA78_28225 [Blastopirellula sp.]
MKFCQFRHESGSRRIGLACQNDKRIADLGAIYKQLTASDNELAAYEFPVSMKAMIEEGDKPLNAALIVAATVEGDEGQAKFSGDIVEFDDTHIHPPIDDPQKFFAIAINRHGGWDSADKPDNPNTTYFVKLSSTIVGPRDTVRIPDAGQVGPEIELAIVIGKPGRDIPLEDALDHIFGLMTHNDITAHEMRRTTEWIRMNRADGSQEHLTYPGRYKNFDTFSPMGPWLVTSDEAPHPDEAILDAWLNKDHVQHGSTADHVYKAAHLISYLSRAHALVPGDIISTGTVGPVEPWTMATINLGEVGGVIHSSIEGLGKTSNPIEFVPGLR